MGEELDELLQFLMERTGDDRLSIQKDIKYGHKNYWITFDVDTEPQQNTNANHWGMISGRLSIHFDTRNGCITITSDTSDPGTVIFEEKDLLDKWTAILEEYIRSNLRADFRNMIEDTFSKCYRKDFHRDWKMRKIFDDEDESI